MTELFGLEKKIANAWAQQFSSKKIERYEVNAQASLPRRGKSVSTLDLRKSLSSTSLVLLGDDRLNPFHQKEAISCLGRWCGKQKTVFLTDRFPQKTKKSIQSFLKNQTTYSVLADEFNIQAPRPFSPEAGVEVLFNWIKKKKLSFHLVSSEGVSLVRRDRSLAQEAARYLKRGWKVVLWTGSLRLASVHIPRFLDSQDVAYVSLLFGVSQIRWTSNDVGRWARSRENEFVYVGGSPLLSLELRRAWENRSTNLVLPEHVEAFFYKCIQKIQKKIGSQRSFPKAKILNPYELNTLSFLRDARVKPNIRKFLLQRVLSNECAVVPSNRTVLLSTLEEGHIAEEAAHYMRLVNVSTDGFSPLRTALEEAFAFLGSRWIDPGRPVPETTAPFATSWEEVHEAGYRLGAKLHDVWRNSKKGRDRIRDAWNQRLRSESDVCRLWEDLEEKM